MACAPPNKNMDWKKVHTNRPGIAKMLKKQNKWKRQFDKYQIEKKKRDLYSVICVCENDFCTFKKSEEGQAKKIGGDIKDFFFSQSRKLFNIEKLLY